MKPTHNIVVAERYEKNGEEKTHWHKIGVVFTGEKDGQKRTAIKIQNIPLNWDGFGQVFEIKPKQPAETDTEDLGAPVDLSEIPF